MNGGIALCLAIGGIANVVALILVAYWLSNVCFKLDTHWQRFNDINDPLWKAAFGASDAKRAAKDTEIIRTHFGIDEPEPVRDYVPEVTVCTARLKAVYDGLQFIEQSLLRTHGASGRQEEAMLCRRRVGAMLRKAIKV